MASMSAAESDEARARDAAAAEPNEPDIEPSENQEPPFKPSVFRTRIVPAFAIVMVVSLLGLLAYAMFAPEEARVGQNWRVAGSGYLVPEGEMEAPDFTAVMFDGGEVNLSDLRGQIVVVNFWASWCTPCRDETPLLEAVQDNLGDDVVLVGLNSGDTEDNARAFLDEFSVTYTVARDVNGAIAVDYGVTGMPETFVIDADGNYAVKYLGEVRSLEQLRGMVAEAR
jgi:cytochrome c biogenesis protein CcmG/thiol:disulfide interchange protein DsbE